MKIEVLGKNGFTPSEANKSYAINKLGKIENLFADDVELEARVVCKVYKEYHKIEVTIPTKNLIMRAEVSDFDLYAAIDKAVDKLLVQVKKHKDKVKSKLEKEGIRSVFKDDLDVVSLEKEIMADKLVRNKEVQLVPMDQEEAMSQMELLGHDFFVYLDKGTYKVNVLYIRDDGNYAVLETK